MGNRNKKEYLRSYKENGIADCLPVVPEEAPLDTTVFNGRIKMLDDVRGFGFIVYDDQDGTRPEIFFHVSNVVSGEPVRRAQVTFELKADEKDGRITAGNIHVQKDSVNRIPDCRGRVDWFDEKRRFGHIRGGENQPIFVHLEQVVANAAGHRCFIMRPGTDVSFILNERLDRTKNTFFATDVRVAEDNSVPDCPEYSRVTRWSCNQQHGVLTRWCGCKLPFHATDVVTEGLQFIRPGDWVSHTTAMDGQSFFASNVTLYEPGFTPETVYEPGSPEAFFAASAEIPEDSTPAEPEPTPVETVYSPEERSLTLRELIRRKKIAA